MVELDDKDMLVLGLAMGVGLLGNLAATFVWTNISSQRLQWGIGLFSLLIIIVLFYVIFYNFRKSIFS